MNQIKKESFLHEREIKKTVREREITMYEQLKALIEESIDFHIYEDKQVTTSVKHPLSRYQIWKTCNEAKEKGLISIREHHELYEYYLLQLDLMINDTTSAILDFLSNQEPYFEVWNDNILYLSTKSIKSKGIQITTFIKRNEELVAWCDRQCASINELMYAIKDYGISQKVYTYFKERAHY